MSDQQLTLLNGITFSIGDLPTGYLPTGYLPTGYLGTALPGQIILSSNAAGQSWFIDSTPLDNSEFTGTGTQHSATSNGGATGRVDALTVILHELGHELGLDHSADGSNLMFTSLTLGERRLPASNQAYGVSAPTGSFADALLLGGAPVVNGAGKGLTGYQTTTIFPSSLQTGGTGWQP